MVLQSLDGSDIVQVLCGRLSLADDVKVKGLHRKMTSALIEQMWEMQGRSM